MSIRPLRIGLACLGLAGLAACGDDGALEVQGDVAIELAADRIERYPFPNPVLLQPDYEIARADGVFAGRCSIELGTSLPLGTEIARPSATDGLTSFRVTAGEGEGGSVSAVVDGVSYGGDSSSGGCSVQITYLAAEDHAAGVDVDCQLDDGSGGSAQAVAELHFSGCSVSGGD